MLDTRADGAAGAGEPGQYFGAAPDGAQVRALLDALGAPPCVEPDNVLLALLLVVGCVTPAEWAASPDAAVSLNRNLWKLAEGDASAPATRASWEGEQPAM